MFRFEPGSYQTPAGFLPALACYKLDKNKKETFDYILTNVKVIELTEQKAIENAEKSLNIAFQKRQKTVNDFDIVQSFKSEGFVKIDDPKFAKD
jgi:hypothetical protein